MARTNIVYPPLSPGQSFTPGPQRGANIQAGGDALARIIQAIKQRNKARTEGQADTELLQLLTGSDQALPGAASVTPRISPVSGVSVSPRTEVEQFELAGAQVPSELRRELGVDQSIMGKIKSLSPERRNEFYKYLYQRRTAQDKAKLAAPAAALKFKEKAETTRLKTEATQLKVREDAMKQIQRLSASLVNLPASRRGKTQELIEYYQRKLDAMDTVTAPAGTAPTGPTPAEQRLMAQYGVSLEDVRDFLAGKAPQ